MAAVVHQDESGFKLVRLTRALQKGEIALLLTDAEMVSTPTRTSIQVGPGRHAEHPTGACINHSCSPTCEILGPFVITLRDLPVGTEVTFDYTKNEGVLASPFTCHACGQDLTGEGPAPCKV